MWFLRPGITFIEVFLRILAILVITFLVLPLHEFAHAFVAYKLGDDTPKYQGRLTLNPLAHFSLVGSIFMLFLDFGWAKPVITDARNFKNPRRDMALVALAGPLSNIFAACLGGFALNFVSFISNASLAVWVSLFISYYISINVSLAVFNLIPLPALDGFKILEAFIPEKLILKYYQNLHIINWIIIILLMFGLFDVPLLFIKGIVYNLVIKLTHIPFFI